MIYDCGSLNSEGDAFAEIGITEEVRFSFLERCRTSQVRVISTVPIAHSTTVDQAFDSVWARKYISRWEPASSLFCCEPFHLSADVDAGLNVAGYWTPPPTMGCHGPVPIPGLR
jgi:hypothetical protein